MSEKCQNQPDDFRLSPCRRFDLRIFMGPPDLNARIKILETILKDLKNNFNREDIRAVAKITDNFSASDLGTIARNAAWLPLGTVAQHLIATLRPDEVQSYLSFPSSNAT